MAVVLLCYPVSYSIPPVFNYSDFSVSQDFSVSFISSIARDFQNYVKNHCIHPTDCL